MPHYYWACRTLVQSWRKLLSLKGNSNRLVWKVVWNAFAWCNKPACVLGSAAVGLKKWFPITTAENSEFAAAINVNCCRYSKYVIRAVTCHVGIVTSGGHCRCVREIMLYFRRLDSIVGMMTGYGQGNEDHGSISSNSKTVLSSPHRTDQPPCRLGTLGPSPPTPGEAANCPLTCSWCWGWEWVGLCLYSSYDLHMTYGLQRDCFISTCSFGWSCWYVGRTLEL